MSSVAHFQMPTSLLMCNSTTARMLLIDELHEKQVTANEILKTAE